MKGLAGLTLSEFCDLVWLEIWDDCPAMGDQPKYREVIQGVFFEGRDAAWVQSRMDAGKKSGSKARTPDLSTPLPSDAVDTLRQMRERFAKDTPDAE